MDFIYEVCDATNDEMYYPMGFFLSEEAAIKAIESACYSKYPLTDNADDYEKVDVVKRKIGMGIYGEVVFTLERNAEYDEETDERIWVAMDR